MATRVKKNVMGTFALIWSPLEVVVVGRSGSGSPSLSFPFLSSAALPFQDPNPGCWFRICVAGQIGARRPSPRRPPTLAGLSGSGGAPLSDVSAQGSGCPTVRSSEPADCVLRPFIPSVPRPQGARPYGAVAHGKADDPVCFLQSNDPIQTRYVGGLAVLESLGPCITRRLAAWCFCPSCSSPKLSCPAALTE